MYKGEDSDRGNNLEIEADTDVQNCTVKRKSKESRRILKESMDAQRPTSRPGAT